MLLAVKFVWEVNEPDQTPAKTPSLTVPNTVRVIDVWLPESKRRNGIPAEMTHDSPAERPAQLVPLLGVGAVNPVNTKSRPGLVGNVMN